MRMLRFAALIARCGFMLVLVCVASTLRAPGAATDHDGCAHASHVYVATRERFKPYIDAFCGLTLRFEKKIEVPTDGLQLALGHDTEGRIYDLQKNLSDDTIATLSMYDGRWTSGPTINDGPYHMVVNATNSKAYVLREDNREDPSWQPQVTAVDGPSQSIENSFQAGPIDHPWLLALDPRANIVVEPMSSRYFAVFAPTDGRLLYKMPSVACAIAAGLDQKLYAVDCTGNLVVYDPSSYREISRRVLVAALLAKDTYRLPEMAVDAAGTVYLADAFSNELMMFRPGESTPFCTIGSMVVRQIELDNVGNAYILAKSNDGPGQSKIYVFSHTTGKQLAVYTFKSGVSAMAMTVTPAN
jgi:hypothetical protein